MDDQPYEKIVRRWWQSMFLDTSALQEKQIQPAPTSHKAELKRCNTADDAMLLAGFRALWEQVLANGYEQALQTRPKERQTQQLEAWATVAAVLVHIKQDNDEKLATRAGKKLDKQGGVTDKSIVSELRFAKLQNAPTPDEFLKRVRRIIQQLDGKVSPTKVAADILQWFNEYYDKQPRKADKRISVQWAMDYYRSASQKASKETTKN